MSATYKIRLTNFEGPLDLLLFFVRKDELNIYDIPIAYITKQYLEYLSLMRDLNLDIAAEFILMAATLMRIKVRSMLPPDPLQEDDEEILDPREELTRRLIEYRQFKEASKTLSELDDYWRTVYRRSYFNFDLLPQQEEGAVGLKDVSFFDLLAAYKKAVMRAPKPIFHQVERLNVTVEGQIQVIETFFQGRTCYLFSDLCEAMGKIEIVVTFLAMLDLIKRGDIAVKQASLFDDIWIYKADEFAEEDPPDMAEPISSTVVEPLMETDSEVTVHDAPTLDSHVTAQLIENTHRDLNPDESNIINADDVPFNEEAEANDNEGHVAGLEKPADVALDQENADLTAQREDAEEISSPEESKLEIHDTRQDPTQEVEPPLASETYPDATETEFDHLPAAEPAEKKSKIAETHDEEDKLPPKSSDTLKADSISGYDSAEADLADIDSTEPSEPTETAPDTLPDIAVQSGTGDAVDTMETKKSPFKRLFGKIVTFMKRIFFR